MTKTIFYHKKTRLKPEKKKASVRDSYKADPEKKNASVRDRYKADPEKKKASVHDSYKADPEKKKASVRDSYNADIESKQSAKRQRYQEDVEENRAAKSSAAIKASERNRYWNDPAVRLAKRAAERKRYRRGHRTTTTTQRDTSDLGHVHVKRTIIRRGRAYYFYDGWVKPRARECDNAGVSAAGIRNDSSRPEYSY
eukprot:Em0003g172a